MGKIVLKNGTEFNTTSAFNNADNQVTYAVTGIKDYTKARTSMNVLAMQEVKYYIDDNSTEYKVYEDYTKFVTATAKEVSNGFINVVFIFERESELEQRVSQNAETIKLINGALDDVVTDMLPAIIQMIMDIQASLPNTTE